VSRRRRGRREPEATTVQAATESARAETRESRRRTAPSWSLGVQVAFLVAVFAVVVLIAELAGAANLGVALGVGQIAFAIAVVYLLVRR
jgi:uncharacterized membrane protein (DUF485 family)